MHDLEHSSQTLNMEKFDLDKLRELSIEGVAKKLGIEIHKHKALCFIHDDHHPSLAFSVSRNTWKCYVCDKGGDAISLVMEHEGLSFMDACRWLCHEYGIDADSVAKPAASKKVQRTVAPKQEPVLDQEILEYIYKTSRLSQTGRRFLVEERGYDEAIIRKLRIRSILSSEGLAAKLISVFGEERATKSGFVRKQGTQYKCFYNSPCLLFPYFSRDGKLQNLQARYLGKDANCPRFQFPYGGKVPIFNLPLLKYIKEGRTLYVSEGVTDCLALLSGGNMAIAIPSATLLKKEELTELAKYRLKMYPDDDEPGQRLFEKIKTGVEAHGGTIEKLSLPAGFKDYSEYYKHIHPACNDDDMAEKQQK